MWQGDGSVAVTSSVSSSQPACFLGRRRRVAVSGVALGGQQLRRWGGSYPERRAGPCLPWDGSSSSLGVSPAPRGHSRGSWRPGHHPPSPRPPRQGWSYLVPPRHVLLHQLLALGWPQDRLWREKTTFPLSKTVLGAALVAVPRQPLSIMALPLPGSCPGVTPSAPSPRVG